MTTNISGKWICLGALATALGFAQNPLYAAANFKIEVTQGTTLPTTVPVNGAVSAFFTVTNLTKSPRNGYTVKGLPKTVTQGTQDSTVPNICGKPINLAAAQSCNLKLTIKGEAKSSFAICKASSCTTANPPLNVSVSTQPQIPTPVAAAGNFNGVEIPELTLPIIALSQDNGSTWTYPDSIFLNPGMPSGDNYALSGLSCNGINCVTAGSRHLTNGLFRPLLASSQDGGVTWAYPRSVQTNFPANATEGSFFGTHCSTSTCIAAGSLTGNDFLNYPLLAASQNNGLTWNYPDSIIQALPQPFFTGGFFDGFCSGGFCIAAGTYNNGGADLPLLAMTQDRGITWTYPSDIQTNLPPNQFSLLIGPSCSLPTCVVPGDFDDGQGRRPLLALTQDSGATWDYPADIFDLNNLPSPFVSGSLDSSSCSNSICVAVGGYDPNGDAENLPLLAMSRDQGNSWTYPVAVNGTLPPTFIRGQFNSVSCSGAICIAAGSTNRLVGSSTRPLLALTRNRGATWTYPAAVRNNLPTDFVEGGFGAASCNGNTCIASGSYVYNEDDFLQRPLIAISQDGGVTWSYPPTVIQALPDDFVTGTMESGAVVSSPVAKLLPSSLQYLVNPDIRANRKFR